MGRFLLLGLYSALTLAAIRMLVIHWEEVQSIPLALYIGLILSQISLENRARSQVPPPQGRRGRALSEGISYLWWLLLILPILEFAFHPQVRGLSLAIGIILVILPGGLRVWAVNTLGRFFSDHVETWEDHSLITGGPYRWIRHPAYLASILQAFGLPLILDAPWSLVLSGLLTVLFILRIHQEERMLKERVAGYEQYMQDTFRLLPGIW